MIGRKLGNRYEVIERIGGGGMAVVYRALDTLLNRYVSIKVLRAQYSTDEDFVRRFRREAQAAASLSHPNVVNIYDVGVEGEDYYIVMEFVDGRTLKEVIQEGAPLPINEAIDIAKQICSALGHAHENNIVHRDIKPHNILISKDKRVKVTDFGIARAITSNTITQDGSVLGSVHYFSPEQARGGITDVKSDIYSLGVVLYEMITGELPFSGETPISVALKHLQDEFMEPRQINPALPQSVENIVLKSLAKNPSVRYQTARDMLRDLEKALLYPNVPKFTVPSFDEHSTIQVPAAGLSGMDKSQAQATNRVPELPNSAGDEPMKPRQPANSNSESEPKKRNFWKPVIWLFVVFCLLGVGAVAAYSLVTNYMSEEDVMMPDVVNLTYEDALKKLVDAGLNINNIHKTEETSDKPPGIVTKQDQFAGKTIKANREVTLTVSAGAEKIEMPKVLGLDKQQATDTIRKLIENANISYIEKEDKDATPGTVIAQSPYPDVIVEPNTKISLTISKEIPKAKIPNLENIPAEEAKRQLTALGFKVGESIASQHATIAKGNVIRVANFAVGTELPKGTEVSLFVSAGPAQQEEDNAPKKKTVEVTVPVKEGTKSNVKIVRTDSRGAADVVSGDEISADKVYSIDCIVEKDQIASIEVYVDGKKQQTVPVPYE